MPVTSAGLGSGSWSGQGKATRALASTRPLSGFRFLCLPPSCCAIRVWGAKSHRSEGRRAPVWGRSVRVLPWGPAHSARDLVAHNKTRCRCASVSPRAPHHCASPVPTPDSFSQTRACAESPGQGCPAPAWRGGRVASGKGPSWAEPLPAPTSWPPSGFGGPRCGLMRWEIGHPGSPRGGKPAASFGWQGPSVV
jgi:hypothetical protein